MDKIIIHRDLTATRYAIVDNGIVIGITTLDIIAYPSWQPPKGKAFQCDDTVSIGDLFDGKSFTKQEPKAEPPTAGIDTLVNVLLKKGVVTAQDLQDAQSSIAVNPDTKPATL